MPPPPSASLRSRRLRRWLLHGLLGGSLAAAAALALRTTAPVRRSELQSYDLRVRGTASPGDTNIVIVAIDEQSMQSLGPVLGRWPWPREVYQRAL
ncbi:MAG TPA: CHASE2 domain-containing protein, partial [Longimicrobiaceae bacterium]|nr:CHASE2 domain-containing protein [Longimicrobiaceae bacterium]